MEGALGSEPIRLEQGCQIFLGTIFQSGRNIPNDHKTFHMTGKLTE
jgi:hypothetical protein